MAEPLKYKVEKAISGFISTGSLSALSGWNHYQGQNPGTQSPPACVVYFESAKESFPNSMPKDCRVVVELVSSIDTDQDADSIHSEATDRATNWSNHRAAVQAVEARLQDLTTLQSYANSGNVVNRPVTGFYLYDIQEDGQSSNIAQEQRMLISTISLTVVCEAQDN